MSSQPASASTPNFTTVTRDNNSLDNANQEADDAPEAEHETNSSISHSNTYTIGSYTLPQLRNGSGHSALAYSNSLNAPPTSTRPRSGSTRSARSTSASVTMPPRSHLPSHIGHTTTTPHSPASHITSFAQQSSNTHISHVSISSNNIPGSSSTHAGGILPSASFFHPSRPSFHANTLSRPRPASVGSDLSSANAQTSFSEDPYVRNATTTTTLTKVSREPLLPIGGGPSSRPKPNHQAQASVGGSGANTSGRVRTSLEKFLRRTLSVDTNSKPLKPLNSETATQDADGRPHIAISVDPYIDFSGGKYNEDDAVVSPVTPRLRSKPSLHTPSRFNLHRISSRTRFDKFNPNPPTRGPGEPEPSETPLEKPDGVKRNWQEHPSRNVFFLNGRLLTGGDSPAPFIGSLCVVFGIAGSWLGTTCVWWWHNLSPTVAVIGAYMTLLVIINMLATALRDPGILPRNLDPDPPYSNPTPSDDGTKAPLPRDLKVRAGSVRVKYCQTCRIYRPPRSSHCRMCDNCVDGCDHHCQWVNNCVGRRNYTSFIVFLTSATLTLCLVICTTIVHLVVQANREELSASESLRKGAGSAVAFAMSIIVVWPVAGLLGYHIRLLILNLTTIEQIRNSAHKSITKGPLPPNPFAYRGWRRNVAELLCRPEGSSWLNATEVATVDKREPNPGSVSEEDVNGNVGDEGQKKEER